MGHWLRSVALSIRKEGYQELLRDHLLPFAEAHLPLNWTFQQDNASVHASKSTQRFFALEKIKVLEWPAQSPDLNPIENLWNTIQRNISNRNPRNKIQLWQYVQEEWRNIPNDYCMKLIDSMPKRIKEVMTNKGYPTHY